MTKKLRKKRRSKAHPEQNFEYRVERLLRNAGFLTLNCASSRPFDIIAIKANEGMPIELKARNGVWTREQREFQIELASSSENGFMFIAQVHDRYNRAFMMDVRTHVYDTSDDYFTEMALEIIKALGSAVRKQTVRVME